MQIVQQIAHTLKLGQPFVAAVIQLLDDGNTIPFIARYRKETSGGMTDEQLEALQSLLTRLRALDERRSAVLKSLEEQGVSDAQLIGQINAAATMTELEDLYAPYRPKRKTRASIAKEKGLDGLAQLILKQGEVNPQAIRAFVRGDVGSEDEALAGARDIIAEAIADHATVRSQTRAAAMRRGLMSSSRTKKGEDPRGTYRDYYEFDIDVPRLRPHQWLAISRAEREKVLSVSVDVPESEWRRVVEGVFRGNPRSGFFAQLQAAIDDAAGRLILPAVERDVRSAITEAAEEHAIKIFADNLRNLLMQPPIPDQVVLALDPGFRTGCKVAVVDPTGKVLATDTIYPHEPQRDLTGSAAALLKLIETHKVTLTAIGNGTASRETEVFVSDLLKAASGLKYMIVSEAGASVYSASALARKELPGLDVSLRGAVSIARRVQDPLAELVKIDPKSLGVGMYQHDVDPKKLSEALTRVITSVVNQVGVDLNTASPALLAYVAGISERVAGNIVAYRDQHGRFKNRKALKKVSGLGERTFEQCAGFLRVYGGDEMLDMSAVHPESYPAAKELLRLTGISLYTPERERKTALDGLLKKSDHKSLAKQLGIGEPTLRDILDQLLQPNRDPRANLPKPVLRSGVLTLEEVRVGMNFSGTVRNVADFGAFIDIGLKNDALLHRSKYAGGVAPRVGDVLQVWAETVDTERGRIGLSLKP